MDKKTIRIILCIVFCILTAIIVRSDGHAVCGQLNDAADGTDASWYDVIMYYGGDKAHNISCEVSSYDQRYCCDVDTIPSHVWAIGDTIYSEVSDNGDGYYAGPVSAITTGGEPDIEPTMTLRHIITIYFPLDATTYYNSSVILNISSNNPYNNTLGYIMDGVLNYTLCNNCNTSDSLITNLSDGEHTITVYANNSINVRRSTDVTFTIDTAEPTDISPPAFTAIPANSTIEYMISSLAKTFSASDDDSVYFKINDSSRFSINSETGELRNMTTILVGSYEINISVNDTSNNLNSTIYSVDVVDTTAPNWNETPTDKSLNYGSDFLMDVNATDASDSIEYSINDTMRFSINSDSGIIVNSSQLTVGAHYLNISASDPYNNAVYKTIIVSVVDAEYPSWIQVPIDQTISHNREFNYDVNATDYIGISRYSINDSNDFEIDAFLGIITNKTALHIGNYYLNISVNDTSNNGISQIISLIVVDIDAPSWNETPSNKTLEYNSGSLYTRFNASDTIGLSLYFINDSFNFNITTDGILTNKTRLAVGIYEINVSVNDTSNNLNSTKFMVSVSSTTTQASNAQSSSQSGGASYNRNKNITKMKESKVKYSEILPDKPVIIKLEDEDFYEMIVWVKEEVDDVKIRSSLSEYKPGSVMMPSPGITKKYADIKETNLNDESLEKVAIKFKIDKSWLENIGTTSEEVMLYQYDNSDNKWDVVSTTKESEDEQYIDYQSITNRITTFAISVNLDRDIKTGINDSKEQLLSMEKIQGRYNKLLFGAVRILVLIALILLTRGIILTKKPDEIAKKEAVKEADTKVEKDERLHKGMADRKSKFFKEIEEFHKSKNR